MLWHLKMETFDPSQRHLAFISSNAAPWGGSEELWSAAAAALAEDGHVVTAFKRRVDRNQPRIRRLRELGCRVHDLERIPFLPRLLSAAIGRVWYPVISLQQTVRLWFGLLLARPELVVISQGGNLDGWRLANLCRRMKLRYVLIAQKAADIYWPADERLPVIRAVYAAAEACYFVSEHNRELTGEQLGIDLPQASVVRNPFLVRWEPRVDWPSETDGLRLACIGRLYPAEKGQDLLLRVLARDKWRGRPLSVTFFGNGPHRGALEQMAQHRGLSSVSFRGFVDDVAAIWDEHHGLVLSSRFEGLPLVIVEAMLSGRVPIATNVAGSGEVIDDDVTGFLAAAPTEESLDEALERAWQRRAEWRQIGMAAARRIRTMVPRDPARTLANQLLHVIDRSAAPGYDVGDPVDVSAVARG
jgi:glycosyltransferase involved in cell wall biosynthesis